MAVEASSRPTIVGKVLGHYCITEKIGEGGMGEVYRAHDQRLDRDVAIKVLPLGTFSDHSKRKHFRKEALALSRLNHPNIETMHDFDSDNGIDFLVTESIAGEGLNQKLVSGALPEKEIVKFGIQLADALAAAHEQGVIHRDLKPDNIRISQGVALKGIQPLFSVTRSLHLGPRTRNAPTAIQRYSKLRGGNKSRSS